MRKSQLVKLMLTGGEVNFTKAWNFLTNCTAMMTKNLTPSGYPSVLQIEPTNYCNLSCPLCPTGNKSLKAPKGFMPFSDFKKIIDECGDYLLNLTLWNYGEPFLNKSIYDMIDYAKSKRIFVRVSTNGHFLNSDENIAHLISSGLDELIVSIDGGSQETFSKYRREGNFDTVVTNLRRLVDKKKSSGKDRPFIELQFIVMAHNEHEIPKMKKLAKEIGVDALKLKTVSLEEVNLGVGGPKRKKEMKKYLPKNEEYARYDAETLTKKEVTKSGCQRLWLSSLINWDGSVVACCYDPHRDFEFGNCLKEGNFKAVWNGKKYQNFRRDVLKNKQFIKMCAECSGKIMEA